jgi:flagellar hook-associated protein 1
MSTFHGLEMAKQALFTQQSALYTTGHNISNANTEGYTRQRVNFETLPAYPAGSRNRPQIPGQIGQGVQAGSVERIRDRFLDLQYRAENSKNGYWQSMSDSLYRMESLLNEPSDSGLSKTMNQFWQSLQDLAVNPDSTSSRSVVVQRGQTVADTFNYLRKNLETMQSDTRKQIEVTIDDANSMLRRINDLNEQIKRVEPHGYLPNDLYDERDVLIDKLSGIVNIKVERVKSAESSLDIAGGLTKITLLDDNGNSVIDLINPGDDPSFKQFDLDANAAVTDIKILSDGNAVGNFNVSKSNGTLSSLINVFGNQDISFSSMLGEINKIADEFAQEFNRVHALGFDLNGNPGGEFFKVDAKGNMIVSTAIVDNPSLIAASSDPNAKGNGKNALDLAGVFKNKLTGLDNTSTTSYFEGLIGRLGVAAQEANRMAANTEVLKSQVEEQRMSVSSVSLDEEMTNMIKFQHAYNAAARSMTAMDEILDKIINSMGIVGR